MSFFDRNRKALAEKGIDPGATAVRAVTKPVSLGVDSSGSAWRTVVTFTSHRRAAVVVMDDVYVTNGRLAQNLSFFSCGCLGGATGGGLTIVPGEAEVVVSSAQRLAMTKGAGQSPQ